MRPAAEADVTPTCQTGGAWAPPSASGGSAAGGPRRVADRCRCVGRRPVDVRAAVGRSVMGASAAWRCWSGRPAADCSPSPSPLPSPLSAASARWGEFTDVSRAVILSFESGMQNKRGGYILTWQAARISFRGSRYSLSNGFNEVSGCASVVSGGLRKTRKCKIWFVSPKARAAMPPDVSRPHMYIPEAETVIRGCIRGSGSPRTSTRQLEVLSQLKAIFMFFQGLGSCDETA